MKTIFKKVAAASAVAGLMAFSLTPLAIAQPSRAQEARTNAQERVEQAEQMRTTASERATEQREKAKERLESAKLRACQQREKAITNIMARMSDRGQKQVDLFTKISERVQQFHEDKNLSAANYDALVSEAEAKKASAQAAVDELKGSTVEFKCDGEDPKGVAETFKGKLKAQNEALQAYRLSVKNLIVAVAQANETASQEETGGEQ